MFNDYNERYLFIWDIFNNYCCLKKEGMIILFRANRENVFFICEKNKRRFLENELFL